MVSARGFSPIVQCPWGVFLMLLGHGRWDNGDRYVLFIVQSLYFDRCEILVSQMRNEEWFRMVFFLAVARLVI